MISAAATTAGRAKSRGFTLVHAASARRRTFYGVDAFDLMTLFRGPRRHVGIALVSGLLLAPTQTTALISRVIDAKGTSISDELTKALRPPDRRHGDTARRP
jgi:hypothetical protein